MHQIDRTHYHELNLILWDIHQQFVAPKTAFQLYEKRWGYVDKTKLTSKEKQLINQLTQEFGNGCFMPATH